MKALLTASALSAATLMAACSTEPDLYVAPKPEAVQAVRISYTSVAVQEVSLPTYAASQDISVADASGKISPASDSLWADEGTRAVTLSLAQGLSDATNARVAPAPWPFLNRPDVTVDVRFESFVADASGQFTLRGMYFIAPEDASRADRSRSFEITEAYDATAGIPAIAAARSAAMAKLAQDIATRGLR